MDNLDNATTRSKTLSRASCKEVVSKSCTVYMALNSFFFISSLWISLSWKADAPHFQIDTNNGIKDSKVVVSLAKADQPMDARLKRYNWTLLSPSLFLLTVSEFSYFSSYQFVVEKGREIHSPITSCTNASMETCSTITKTVFNGSYIAAEVPASPNNASSFTIGDGLYYHGFRNVPLEPGCMYRVHVRIVTIAMDGVISNQGYRQYF